MCLDLPLHRPSTSISISISIYDSLSLYLSPSLSLSPLPLPLPLPPPLSLPLPHFSLRRAILTPISKARNTTALLQASAAATAARVLRQIPLRPPESLLRPIPLRPQESTATAWLNHGACRARQHTVAHKSATEATPQRAATAANQWADEGPTPDYFSVRAWPFGLTSTLAGTIHLRRIFN